MRTDRAPSFGPHAHSLKYALRRVVLGLRDENGQRLTLETAREFTDRLFAELTREARVGAVRVAGGSFTIRKRKPRRAVLNGEALALPATKRAHWRGPKL